MPAVRRKLHQFPISHYCEKTRWQLEHKGLAYAIRDVLPGAHFFFLPRKEGRRATVPVLEDGDTVLCDSTDIAMHLERHYPERSLLPQDETTRAKVVELEAYFDEAAGVHVRRWLYGEMLREPGRAARAFFSFYPVHVRAMRPFMGAVVERTIRRIYRIDEASTQDSRRRVMEALDRLEKETEGDPGRYLVGDALSLADITAAALLAPFVAPPGSPYQTLPRPPAIEAAYAEMAKRSAVAWVEARYRSDRRAHHA